MDDLSWTGKVILAVAFILSFFATQGIMGMAGAKTYLAPQFPPHVNVCQPIMSDSTPLVYPFDTNAVINPTESWGLHSMTLKKASFLMLPHSYQGKEVCVLDTRAGAGLLLQCEAILGHGRHETFHAFADALKLYPSTK